MVNRMDKIIEELKGMNLGKVLTDVPLKNYTTYKVGGNAKAIIILRIYPV